MITRLTKLPGSGITLISFGYKHGPAPQVTYVSDLRYLPNPHSIAALRPLTGLDRAVQDYMFTNRPAIQSSVEGWADMLDTSIRIVDRPITMAFGCTGGRHRSVAFVERLAHELETLNPNRTISIFHRDLERSA